MNVQKPENIQSYMLCNGAVDGKTLWGALGIGQNPPEEKIFNLQVT